jgi:hypothetical protein
LQIYESYILNLFLFHQQSVELNVKTLLAIIQLNP